MPELPEVETIVRDLAPHLVGRRIVETRVLGRLSAANCLEPSVGAQICSVRRYGKYILIECDAGVLTVHLGMTGKLLWQGATSPYTRIAFQLDEGRLIYDDARQFGRVRWSSGQPAELERLGPDPLAIAPEEFIALVQGRRGQIKPLLLNQRVLRGLGNIYADEALFRARIHPRARCISAARARRLHQAIVAVLEQAIAHRGSSISDYVDAEGRQGAFQHLHQVYGKQGRPCPACGAGIRRIEIAQRGAYYCPRCQRR